MSALRTSLRLVSGGLNTFNSTVIKQNNEAFKQCFQTIQKRSMVIHKLTGDINYLTNDKNLKIKIDPETMKLAEPNERPLCVMLTWLGSTQKHISKYADVFLEQGYDLLTAQTTMKQALWPEPYVKKTANDLMKFFEQNLQSFHPTVVYGFSIGSYLWSEVLKVVEKDVDRYKPILNIFNGQIWDSIVDYDGFKNGVAKAIFPDNKALAYLIEKYLNFHMEKFYERATIHYFKGSEVFHRSYCTVPTMHFCSRADKVGTYPSNMNYMKSWKEMGIPLTQKVFEDTPHVQHFYYYPKEYLTELYNFLDKNQLLFKPELLVKRIENAKNVLVAKIK